MYVPNLVKYDEKHGFHNEENRFEVYEAMLLFRKRYEERWNDHLDRRSEAFGVISYLTVILRFKGGLSNEV